MNLLSRNHLLERRSWTSGSMLPGFYRNSGTSGEGIGLNYHLGLFKQVFEDNLQHEVPNPWITPDSWLTATNVTYMVPFRGFSLKSTMYSIDVAGYENKAIHLNLF